MTDEQQAQQNGGNMPARQEQPKPSMQTGNRGLELRSLDDMWRFARAIAQSGLAPKGMETPEALLVAIQMGAEVGLSPMAAIQNIAVINGRPSLWGDAVLAVCRSSGVFDEEAFAEWVEGSGEQMVAHCRVRRLGGQLREEQFGVKDAKAAGLWDKKGPWQEYPQRMLQMRARGFALRDTFGDFLRGIGVAEEQHDIVQARMAPQAEQVGQPAGSKLDQMAESMGTGEQASQEPAAEPDQPAEAESDLEAEAADDEAERAERAAELFERG